MTIPTPSELLTRMDTLRVARLATEEEITMDLARVRTFQEIKPGTQPAWVLQAAVNLGKGPFALALLVVHAWGRHYEEFGLEGCESDHPDSAKVASIVMGQRGLVARGYLEKVRPKVYRVTERGREWVRKHSSSESEGT